ncbi:MFS transporter [Tardiphaga sp.]|uniref:MFS transporter n=1 Tax=Tardiphaga sp. TaxID=1926292 RepID=UPI00352A0A95
MNDQVRTHGAPASAAVPTIATRLDGLPVSPLHLGIFALCAFGLFADIAEVALSNAFSGIFLAPPYSISRGDLSLLLASVFAGGAVGAPVFGWIADRYGRQIALQSALAVLALSSLAVAASRDVATMTAFRFISGLAIGGYPPLTSAYLSDLLPPKRRGSLMMLCGALAFLGAPAIILMIRWLTPIAPWGIEGWRWALIFGSACSTLTGLLFFLVPESPRWLASVGRDAEADVSCRRFEASARQPSPPAISAPETIATKSSGFRALARDRISLRRTALLAALYVLGPWATIGFPLLSAAVMVQKGFHVSESLLFAGLTMFGPSIGIAAAAAFVDRIPRRLALIACAVVMIATGLTFAISTVLTPLIVTGIVFNLASAVYSAVLSLYAVELLPTHLRASATAGAWGLGRIVSALVPIALLPLLGSHGAIAMFTVISAALIVSGTLIGIAGPPGRERKPVD